MDIKENNKGERNRKKYSARPSLKLAHCFGDWALVPSGWFTPNHLLTLFCLFASSLATSACFHYVLLPVLFVFWQARWNAPSYLLPNVTAVCSQRMTGYIVVKNRLLSVCTRTISRRQFKTPFLKTVHILQVHFYLSSCLIWGNCSISVNIHLVILCFYKL